MIVHIRNVPAYERHLLGIADLENLVRLDRAGGRRRCARRRGRRNRMPVCSSLSERPAADGLPCGNSPA